MDTRQLAALGPGYGTFKQAHGTKSGVPLREALAHGINVDAFERARDPGALGGELVLKVWTTRSAWRMLWCYVATDGGGLACFPIFRSNREAPSSPARVLMRAPLGARIRAELEPSPANPRNPTCASVELA